MGDPATRDEDDLEELPPLDGDSNDPPEAEPTDEDIIKDEDREVSLDDATADDEPPDASDLDLDGAEGGWLNEGAEAQDLDLGDSALVDFDDDERGGKPGRGQNLDGTSPATGRGQNLDGTSPATGRGQNLDDDLGAGDEDFGFGEAPERGGLDAGDEGPLDADEELREADLPALDADEEGELEDAALVDVEFASDEALGLPWASRPWTRVGAPFSLAGATAVTCVARGALVTAQLEGGAAELVRVDLEGTCDRLTAVGLDAARVRALAVDGRRIAAVIQGGKLVISFDGGTRFDALAVAESVAVSDAVFASGRLWMRTSTGGLLSTELISADVPLSADVPPGASQPARPSIERYPIPGVAAALTLGSAPSSSVPRELAVLVVDDSGQPAAVVRPAAPTSVRREPFESPGARVPALFAARGGHLAYAARRSGVVRRMAGAKWESFEWDGRVMAMAFVDDDGTLVAATYSDADDTTALVRLDSFGTAVVVGRVGAIQADPRSDGLVIAMAHDEAHGVVWVAGGFGLSAFATI